MILQVRMHAFIDPVPRWAEAVWAMALLCDGHAYMRDR